MRALHMLCLASVLTAFPAAAQTPTWTIMVWLNGDNNLEKSIVQDWHELAAAGSSEGMNIVVQLDQRQDGDTYRFRIPQNASRKLDSAANIGERNMVRGEEIAEFVQWAREHHKADRYALIISSHGDGWREFPVGPASIPARAVTDALIPAALRAAPAAEGPSSIFLPPGVFAAPARTISADDRSPGDALYGRELADNLRTALGDEPLDVIVFDACLMGMIENAYGLRDVARYFVGSEELVATAGMNYTRLLADLRQRPLLDGRDFAQQVVKSYRDLNGPSVLNDQKRTLAAFRLDFMKPLADAVSALATRLGRASLGERRLIQMARERCPFYAAGACQYDTDCIYHIDLKRFTDLLAQHTRDPRTKALAEEVSRQVVRARVEQYAGTERGCDYGSEGLAIYFPRTRNQFSDDPLHKGAYRKTNKRFPVEFVQDTEWSNFLHIFFLNTREELPQ